MSRPVAASIAIWQNASAGVRTLIACQFRLRTSTVALFNTSFIHFTRSVWCSCFVVCEMELLSHCRKVVARRGYAPRTPGCKPGVMLFHHRAGTGCRAWNRTTILSFKARCPTVGLLGKTIGARGRIRTCTGGALDAVPLLLGYTSKTGGPGGSCTHISSLKRRKLYLIELPTRCGAPGEARTRFFGLKVRDPTHRRRGQLVGAAGLAPAPGTDRVRPRL